MLLVVDVGNTHITLGVFDGKDIKATFRATAKQPRTSDEYGIQLCDLLDESLFQSSDGQACTSRKVGLSARCLP